MLLRLTKPADPPQYGRRMHVGNDPDFHEFMFGWDWCEPEREFGLDPWQFAADEPMLAAQGDYQADVSPLTFGRVLSEAEDGEAAAPLVLMPGPNALDPARTFPRPTRLAIRGHWRRREGFNEAWGRLFRSHGSEYEWHVSLRPAPFGYAIYLRTYAGRYANGRAAPPLNPLGTLSGLHRERQPERALQHDYVLVDAGEGCAHQYVCQVVFVPTLKAAKALAVKAAWRDLRPFPQAHAPTAAFRWLRVLPWREIVFA
jgi:hypothetical protein